MFFGANEINEKKMKKKNPKMDRRENWVHMESGRNG